MALNGHEVTNGNNDLLDLLSKLTSGGEDKRLAGLEVVVNLLKDGDGESGGLSGSGLCLGDNVVAFDIVRPYTAFSIRIDSPLITGMIARCWIAEGRSKP